MSGHICHRIHWLFPPFNSLDLHIHTRVASRPPLNNISHLVTTAITLHSLPRPLHIKTMVIHNILSSHIP